MPTSIARARQRVGPAIVGLGAVGATAVAFVVEPTKTSWLPKCPFHLITGLYCPGCGSTRALHELTHGDFSAALHNNVMLVAMIPLLFVAWLMWMRHGDERPLQIPARLGVTLAAAFVVFTVARNIAQFNFLAPIG